MYIQLWTNAMRNEIDAGSLCIRCKYCLHSTTFLCSNLGNTFQFCILQHRMHLWSSLSLHSCRQRACLEERTGKFWSYTVECIFLGVVMFWCGFCVTGSVFSYKHRDYLSESNQVWHLDAVNTETLNYPIIDCDIVEKHLTVWTCLGCYLLRMWLNWANVSELCCTSFN